MVDALLINMNSFYSKDGRKKRLPVDGRRKAVTATKYLLTSLSCFQGIFRYWLHSYLKNYLKHSKNKY